MKTFLHNRLWRERMIDQWQAQGHIVKTGLSLTDVEFKKALLEKLIEEVDEVLATQSNDELVKEIADVYEVLDVMIKAHGLSKDSILAYQEAKKAERGTFTKNSFVKTFSPRENSEQEAYCVKNVFRAPEIIE